MTLPAVFTAKLQAEIATMSVASDQIAATWALEYGIPPDVSYAVLQQLNQEITYAQQAVNGIGFNMPKNWDIDNRLVEGMIVARTTPSTALRGTAGPRTVQNFSKNPAPNNK